MLQLSPPTHSTDPATFSPYRRRRSPPPSPNTHTQILDILEKCFTLLVHVIKCLSSPSLWGVVFSSWRSSAAPFEIGPFPSLSVNDTTKFFLVHIEFPPLLSLPLILKESLIMYKSSNEMSMSLDLRSTHLVFWLNTHTHFFVEFWTLLIYLYF